MKLRINGNSVRLRLSLDEIARFSKTGAVEDAIEFGVIPSQRLIYAVRADSDAERPLAFFGDGRMTIVIPQPQADKWISNGEVGIEGESPIDETRTLRILVERDFAGNETRNGEDDASGNRATSHPDNAIVLEAD